MRMIKGLLLSITVILSVSCSLLSANQEKSMDATATDAVKILPSNIPTTKTIEVKTPTPEEAPSPTKDSLHPKGPYVLLGGDDGIWITNPDGSSPTQISVDPYRGDLRSAISDDGKQLAQIVRTDEGLDLIIISIPDGKREIIARLIEITPEEEASDATSKNSFALYAIRDYPNISWQPGSGKLLAFTGAVHGVTSDLYIYDTETSAITQLTDGPSQAIMPIWSPDGEYILHFGVSWIPPFGGAILGANRMDGLWSVHPAEGDVITLPKPKGTIPHFVGWQDSSHFITYDSDDTCYSKNLRSVNVVTGKSTPLMKYSFYYGISKSTENGFFLFAGAEGCPDTVGEGVFLLKSDSDEPIKLLDKRAYEVDWLPESMVFQAYPEALFTDDGSVRYDPPVYDASYHPAISSTGYQAWEVIQDRKSRIVIMKNNDTQEIPINGFVESLTWDPINGSTLLIVLDDGSLFAATSPKFTPRLMGNLGKNNSQAIWIK